jgi:hypothetical protein
MGSGAGQADQCDDGHRGETDSGAPSASARTVIVVRVGEHVGFSFVNSARLAGVTTTMSRGA